jgi:hypothetical protein
MTVPIGKPDPLCDGDIVPDVVIEAVTLAVTDVVGDCEWVGDRVCVPLGLKDWLAVAVLDGDGVWLMLAVAVPVREGVCVTLGDSVAVWLDDCVTLRVCVHVSVWEGDSVCVCD